MPSVNLPTKPFRSRQNIVTSTTAERHSAPGNPSSGSEVDFLFVVNELILDPEYPRAADRWGNLTPPETWDAYESEKPGCVFRYRNGLVTPEEAFIWHRPSQGMPGRVGYWDVYSDEGGHAVPVFHSLYAYSTVTMFNCGPFLPCVYGTGDVSEDDGEFDGWRALHFHHMNGVSQASPNGGSKCVAGRKARFIGELLPTVYTNHDPDSPPSRGMGGQAGLVIALMALSQSPGQIDAAFRHSKWDNNQWTGHRHDVAWPSTGDEPRGVIVHIALDTEERDEVHVGAIREFEWQGVFVAG